MSASTQRSRRDPSHVRRSVVGALGTAALLATLATPATAAQPNHQACLGHDVRVYAQGGSAFGAFVSGELAADGAGTEIQAHLAGLATGTSPNTCND